MNKIHTEAAVSYKFLSEIEGVKLTNRQIDVAACLIGRQKRKVICKILGISLSTFIEHLRKLKSTIQYSKSSKQLDILEFLETSKQYQYLKNHYIKLLIQHVFEKVLCSISKQLRVSENCIIDYHGGIDRRNLLNKKIQEHLKLVGIDLNINRISNQYTTNHVINIISVDTFSKLNPVEKSNSKNIYLIQSSNNQSNSFGLYYESFFKLLEIILGDSKVTIFYDEFNAKKSAYEKNLFNNDIYLAEPYKIYHQDPKKQISECKRFASKGSSKFFYRLFSENRIKILATIILFVVAFAIATGKVTIFINRDLGASSQGYGLHKLIYYLPVRNKKFIGRRNTFNVIRNNLNKSNIGIIVQAIIGAGGIGKTQLAIEYAYRSIENGEYDAVLWVTADNSVCINDAYTKFASKLKINTNGLKPKEIREMVHNELLDTYRFKKVLFILDNVPTRKDIKQYLKELHNQWPINVAPHILITSRSQGSHPLE